MEHKLVRKSNFLIEASYKLSLVEQRIVMMLASMIKPNDDEFKKYSLNIKDFSALLELKNKDEYAHLQTVTKKLLTRAFTVKMPNEILQIGWLSSARYLEGQGIVELCFDPQLKPFLLQLKDRFTSYRLKNVIQLRSSFSIRIYELLKQYERLAERTFLLETLRKHLGLEDHHYKLYGDFKRNILLVAQAELAEKTDLIFDFEEIKVARRVGKIRFIIKSQVPVTALKELNLEDMSNIVLDPQLIQLFDLLPEAFQGKQSIRKVVQNAFKQHSFDYVMRNIIYSNDRSNALKPGTDSEKGSNYRVYLAKALNDDYGLAYYEDQLVKKEVAQIKQKTLAEAEQQKQRENHKIDQERENRERARIFIASYAPETMQAYEEEAKKLMSPESLARYLRKDPIGNFEFKRRLEDIVMEHTGIRKPQPEAASESPENKPAGREKEAAAE
jgi:plasmid replication initiation protein